MTKSTVLMQKVDSVSYTVNRWPKSADFIQKVDLIMF